MNLRTVIVDDEPLARRGVRTRLLRQPAVTVLEECGDGASAISAIQQLAPNLVFLDIQMPDMTGFEVLQRLEILPPAVIFLTAYDQFAVRAFEADAIDYLLKPVDSDRFQKAVTRARRQLELSCTGAADSVSVQHNYVKRLAVRSGSRVSLVDVDDIDWIEATGDYASLHAGGKMHLLRETLASLEQRLDPERFVRIHRSSIVRLDRVAELRVLPNREFIVRLACGAELRLSRSYSGRLDGLLK